MTNVFWIYTVIDCGVSYTYQQVTLDKKESAVELLGKLIVRGGQNHTKKDIPHSLRQTNKDAFIVKEDNLIEIDGVTFVFTNGKLTKVH